MKKEFKSMSWICQHFNCNAQVIEDYDVLKHREDSIKKLKKKCSTKEQFATLLKIEMMYGYWSKCEWELILEVTGDNRIILSPWVGCSNADAVRVDVTDSTDFDWKGFAGKHIGEQDDFVVKIDVYDQLQYRWNEFVDYCWNFHHKYQRRKANG